MNDYGPEKEARLYRTISEIEEKPLKEQYAIFFVATVLCIYLWFIYDYVYYCLIRFGFLGTLPFWFIGFLFTYSIFNLASSNNLGKSFMVRSACFGIDMTVLSGYILGHMTFGGWLMLAVGIGLISGLIFNILFDCLVIRKDNQSNKDSFMFATVNRKVIIYSFLFLVCMSIINGIFPRF